MKKPIIFVVGNSRSGTTMMARILENHHDVFRFLELHFFEELWSPADRDRRLSDLDAIHLAARLLSSQRDDYMFRADIDRYLDEAEDIIKTVKDHIVTSAVVYRAFLTYETFKNNKKIPLENTPRNVFYIGEILKLFPEAKIINMIRDPRDILLSQKRKWRRLYLRKGGFPLSEAVRVMVNYHPFTISKLWNSSIHAAAKFNDNQRVFSLRYEDLITAPDQSTKLICNFIGIGFNSKLLEVPQGGSSSVKDNNVQKGIRKDRTGGWKKGGVNSTEVYICEKVTYELMGKYGYQFADIRPNPLLLVYYAISFPVKISLALLMNLRRMRNMLETIKRRF